MKSGGDDSPAPQRPTEKAPSAPEDSPMDPSGHASVFSGAFLLAFFLAVVAISLRLAGLSNAEIQELSSALIRPLSGSLTKLAYSAVNLAHGRRSTGRLITIEELAKHGPEARRIWISLLGHVFDVTAGPQHYGPDGGYSFFAGKDGSRAFYSGEFNEDGLIDDISDFKADAMHGLWDWVKFYREHEKYFFVGFLVESRFFDDQGRETELLKKSREMAREWEAGRDKSIAEDWTKNYPRCNMEWSQEKGSRVWCEDPARFPRQTTVMMNGVNEDRCICESHSGFNMDSRRLYPGCHHEANSCSFKSLS